MPELPEVEVLRRELEPVLSGKGIREVRLADPLLVLPKTKVEGKTIHSLERLGKYLIFAFCEGGILAIHLGMTGQLRVEEEDLPVQHKRASFVLTSGACLLFIDPRKFGKITFLDERRMLEEKLGVDPFSQEFTFPKFLSLLEGKRRLKDFLLDQRYIAGIGNIYASEILFRARLHPERPLLSLSSEEKARLFAAIREVLEAAIAAKGTTIRDFRRPSGEEGGFQEFLAVYGKRMCPGCGAPLVRKVIASRSTYFCPRCQE